MKHEWAPGPQRARRNAAQRKCTPVGARTARPRLPEIEQKRWRTRLGESPSQSLPCVKGGAHAVGGGIVFVLPLDSGERLPPNRWNRGIQSLSRPAAASSLYTREPLRGPSHLARRGCRGCFLCFGWGSCILTPDDFSLVPPGGTVSFCKKEMVGPTVPRLEGGFPRLRPGAASFIPARGGNPARCAD